MLREKIRALIDPVYEEMSLEQLVATLPPSNGELGPSGLRSLTEDLYWLEGLLRWLKRESMPGQRLELFLTYLNYQDPVKVKTVDLFRSVIRETTTTPLLSQTGLVEHTGFFREAIQRLWTQILPRPPDDRDIALLLNEIYRSERETEWIARLPIPLVERVKRLLGPETLALFRPAALESLALLGTLVASISIHPDLRDRLEIKNILESPFLRLNVFLQYLAHEGYEDQSLEDWRRLIHDGRTALNDMISHLEQSGVSIDIVFKVEIMHQVLDRIEGLLLLLRELKEESHSEYLRLFLSQVLRASSESRTLSGYWRRNTHLLARKVVERTGVSGEKYIAHTRDDYFSMLKSAAGGGFLTTLTTILKLLIHRFHTALFFEGFFIWINYASSFLAMQFLHFSLATKLSAMTASTIAGRMQRLNEDGGRREFLNEVAALVRSQIAAVVGNVSAVVATSACLLWILSHVFHWQALNPEYAEKIVNTFHPLRSLTIPYAALTGVLLWVSSLIAGWFDNWIVFHRIPQCIARHRNLRRAFGVEYCERASNWLQHNAAGIAGNISLGFMLAFVPVLGHFFGLPIDIRHVTLGAGAVTFALWSLPWDFHLFWWMVSGLVAVGALNIGVSFALSALTAARARNLKQSGTALVFGLILHDFITSPARYFFPPFRKSKPSTPEAKGDSL